MTEKTKNEERKTNKEKGDRNALADSADRDLIKNDLDSTPVVEAAAGTGKTTELVNRIVRVIESGRRAEAPASRSARRIQKCCSCRIKRASPARRSGSPAGRSANQHHPRRSCSWS